MAKAAKRLGPQKLPPDTTPEHVAAGLGFVPPHQRPGSAEADAGAAEGDLSAEWRGGELMPDVLQGPKPFDELNEAVRRYVATQKVGVSALHIVLNEGGITPILQISVGGRVPTSRLPSHTVH
ncbi:MAG: hypothetical protein OXQ93_08140 [Gemmatimonadota bacterium]|nr:hypothetical protein [Gemmatimonadota bacterium]